MNRPHVHVLRAGGLLAGALLALATHPRAARAEAADAFAAVRPVLEQRCVSCHGPEKQKGNLRLDSREATLRGGDLGPSVVPGNPDASLLLQAVRHTHPDLEMPPKDPLRAGEIAALEHWIRAGAPWPEPAPPTASTGPASAAGSAETRLGDAWSDPRNPITRIFHGQRLDLWSLKPLRTDPPPPSAPTSTRPHSGSAAARHPIDRFVRAGLAAKGHQPAPPADRRTLARRAAFDLTGLPPEPALLDAFLADARPGAWERYVDSLLASPRFGEHQARLWLDVVRYSDSNGFDWDEFRPAAWRFRDYVVRAFNADKPFDTFVREQLAGDELIEDRPRDAADQDRLVATGYLRLGPQDNSASLFNEQARARAEWMADLTETTGSAFLGVTLSCCRCHDHKFDPLSQADHFRLRAFFEPLRHGDDLALDLADDHARIQAQHEEIARRLEPLEKERRRLLESTRERLRTERLAALDPAELALLRPSVADIDPSPKLLEKAAAAARRLQPSDDETRKAFAKADAARHTALSGEIDTLKATRRAFTRGLLATDTTEPPPPTRILYQGDHRAEREEVRPGFLSALDPNPAEIPAARNPKTTGRRLALANWIASPGNPLTARVYVNRAWQSLFGRGLVGTPNDFGLAGARPTHPELLDWLARDFIDSGWSTKHLLRRIATSDTYRQATVHPDPEGLHARTDHDNTLLWRQNLRRLSAEQLRDTLLAASGLLQFPDGGPAAWPELPPEILQANPAFLDDNAEKTKGWYPSPPEHRTVRSLYLVQKRTVRVPFLETFDLPDNGTSCPRRAESIVAPQALSLLNGPDALLASRALASRVERDSGPDPERQVRRIFEIALQRAPSDSEAAACRAFLSRQPLLQLARALVNLNEFAFLD